MIAFVTQTFTHSLKSGIDLIPELLLSHREYEVVEWFSNILWDKGLIVHVPFGLSAVHRKQGLKEFLGFRDMSKHHIKYVSAVSLTFSRLQS